MKSTNIDKKSSRELREKKVAKILFEAGCVIFRPHQPIKLISGLLTPIYVDNRRLISFPKERDTVAAFLADLIKENGIPDLIAGAATGGIPHASWVAQKLNVPMVYVRSKPKDHGQGNQIEGILKRGQRVVVVEDMVSTGSSSSEVIKALKAAGARILYEVAIYTHNLKAADTTFKQLNVKFVPLTKLFDVAAVANKQEFLTDKQVELVLSWSKDPGAWSKKMGFEK